MLYTIPVFPKTALPLPKILLISYRTIVADLRLRGWRDNTLKSLHYRTPNVTTSNTNPPVFCHTN